MVIDLAVQLQGKVKDNTPVKTGHLRNEWHVGSIEKRGNEYYIEVYNNVEYVEPVEYGHQTRGGTITKNLYINPALMLNASDSGEDIKKPFITPFEPQEAYEFLKEFHEKYVLKKGDTVVVHITGSSFYIAGKAVKA